MTSMQDALTEALEHPLEYHPQRPRPLGKMVRQANKPLSMWWGVLASFVGVTMLMRVLRHRS